MNTLMSVFVNNLQKISFTQYWLTN